MRFALIRSLSWIACAVSILVVGCQKPGEPADALATEATTPGGATSPAGTSPAESPHKDTSSARTSTPDTAPDQIPALDSAIDDPAIAKAIAAVTEKTRLEPASGEAWGELGMIYLAHELPKQAAACFVRAAKAMPRDPRWPYYHAHALVYTHKDEAVGLYRRAAELSGDDPEIARMRLIELLLELNRSDEAEKEIDAFLHKRVNHPRALIGRGRLMLQRNQPLAAIDPLSLATLHPEYERTARHLLAQAYLRMGENAKSEEQLAKVAEASTEERDPDPYLVELSKRQVGLKKMLNDADKLFGQGLVRDKIFQSIEILQRAGEEYPRNEFVWIRQSRNLIRLRRMDEGEEALAKALAINPNSVEALYRLGVAKMIREDLPAAADAFRRALAVKPDFADAHHTLGFCLRKLGKNDEARREFEAALASNPNYFASYAELADILVDQGDKAAAQRILDSAPRPLPEKGQARDRFNAVSGRAAAK